MALALVLLLGVASRAGGAVPVAANPSEGAGAAAPGPTPHHPACTNCVIDNITTGLGMLGINYDPNNQLVYASSSMWGPGQTNLGAAVQVIDPSTNQVTVNVTVSAVNVVAPGALDTSNNNLYVPTMNDQGSAMILAIVNTVSQSLTGNITVPANPEQATYDPSNGEIYVSDGGSVNANVSAVDPSTSSIQNIPVGTPMSVGGPDDPVGILYVGATNTVYVANDGGANVTEINAATNTVSGSIALPMTGNIGAPYALAYDSANSVLYVLASNGAIWADNTTTGAVSSPVVLTPLGGSGGLNPEALAYDAATGCVYSPNLNSNDLAIFDTYTDSEVGTIALTGRPESVGVDPANGEVYVGEDNAAAYSSQVAVIAPSDCPRATGAALTGVTISPSSVTLGPGGTNAFTANPTCTPGSCPAGITYAWSLTNTAYAQIVSGSAVQNQASVQVSGSRGSVGLFVNATFGSSTVMGGPAIITMTPSGGGGLTVSSVSISASPSTVALGGSSTLTATPTCSSSCPGGLTYAWSLTSSVGGTLSSPSGNPITFTAGSKNGTVSISVHVSYAGSSAQGSTTVTVGSGGGSNGGTGGGSGFLGLPGIEGLALIGGIAAVAAVAGVALYLMRSGKVGKGGGLSSGGAPPSPGGAGAPAAAPAGFAPSPPPPSAPGSPPPPPPPPPPV